MSTNSRAVRASSRIRRTGVGAAIVALAAVVGQAVPSEAVARGERPGVDEIRAARVEVVKAKEPRPVAGYDAAVLRSQSVQNQPIVWPSVGTYAVGTSGHLKVATGQLTATAKAAAAADLTVLGQAASRKAGIAGIVLKVASRRGAKPGSLSLTTRYAKFAHAYGADFGGRLRAFTYPVCLLTTPKKAACQVATPLKSVNNADTATLSTAVPTSSSPKVVALTAVAASSTGTGDFSATPLAASSSWTAGGSAGGFNWTYPMRAVAPNNGPSPMMNISYSSQSVDGRTASTNNQSSMLGEGFDLSSSYIERGYVTCKDDGQAGKYDLCWKTDNATLTLNGRSAELIKAADGTWRASGDDGTRVRRLTSTSTYNLDNDKEYWEVTVPDGTKYFFGRTTSTGQTGDTGSVWTVPVFGDDAGEPCNKSTFATSACSQAWRWNLDYVIDPYGNAMSLWYTPEYNYYAQNKVASPSVKYTRGGRLDRVDYGLRDPGTNTNPPFRVTYAYGVRCLQATGCDTYSKAKWPDTPYDQICASGAACTGKFAPTFFTRFRLATLTTNIRKSGAYSPVESWTFTHKFLDSGTAADGTLWLERITHKGLVGSAITLPDVVLSAAAYANRVDSPTDGIDSLPRFRLRTVRGETGGLTSVFYGPGQCTASSKPTAADNNKMLCFPQKWTPEGNTSARTDYFHKYIVDRVTEEDTTGLAPPVTTYYTYLGDPAWAYDDNKLVADDYRTWSQWRGFGKVKTVTGTAGFTDRQTQEVVTYFRGMNGDKQTSGTPRQVSVEASDGSSIVDRRELAGFERERFVYNEAGGSLEKGAIYTPWVKVTAGSGQKTAAYVKTAKEETRALLSDGTWRRRAVSRTYDDASGQVTRVSDTGDQSDPDDQTCIATTYVDTMSATGVWKLGYPARVVSSRGLCSSDALAPTESNVISDTRKRYDNLAQGVAPTTTALVTEIDRLKSYESGQPKYQLSQRTTYDAYGRPLTHTVPTAVSDSATRQTSMAYVMSSDGTLTGVTETVDVGGKAFATAKLMAPEWGSPTKVTDPNGKSTVVTYDALGRITSVWKPNRAVTASASTKYAYTISQTGATAVRTSTLNRDGSGYVESVEVFDSLLRPRQSQVPSPSGGRVISGTAYDGRGLAVRTFAKLYAAGAPAPEIVQFDEGAVPTMAVTTYDGQSRPTKEQLFTFNTARWSTTTAYAGVDKTTVTPPAGAPPVTSFTDIAGRVVRSVEHGTPDLTTRSTYDFRGNLARVESPGGIWTYSYDLRGRKIEATDPDAGTSTTSYYENDLVKVTTDGNGKSVLTTYDNLDRPTATYDGSAVNAAKQLTAKTYDVPAKGFIASDTRYVGGTTGDKFTSSITGYNALYRVSESKFTITKGTGSDLLAGFPSTTTFTRSTVYNVDQSVDVDYLPKAALGSQTALAAEPIQYGYNSLGMPKSMTGRTGILQDVVYDATGQLQQYVLGTGPNSQVYVTTEFDQGTDRLTRTLVSSSASSAVISDRTYTYDASGNPTKESDTAAGDTQCFRYDDHRRLTDAWTPEDAECSADPSANALGGPAPYWQSWTFTDDGHRKTQATVTPTTSVEDTYTYPAAGQPHANFATGVTRVSGSSSGSLSYASDNAGNTISRPGPGVGEGQQTLTWDSEGNLGKLTASSGASTRYVYGADGALLFRDEPGTKVLIYGETEIRLSKSSGDVSAVRTYGTPLGSTATRTSDTQIDFQVCDPQGTALASVDGSNLAATRRFRTPYGEVRGTAPAAWPGQRGFLGKLEDPNTGLTSVGAREYDSSTGRFISVDPLLDTFSPGQMLGYSYANNNPKAFSDPSGLLLALNDGGGGGYSSGSSSATAAEHRHQTAPIPSVISYENTSCAIYASIAADAAKKKAKKNEDRGGFMGFVDDVVGGGKDAVGWTVDHTHDIAEVVGYIPGPGDVVDVIDGVVYLAEGNYGMAAASGVGAFPFVGSFGKSAIRHGDEVADGVKSLTKHGDDVEDTVTKTGPPRDSKGRFTKGAGGESLSAEAGRRAHKNYEIALGGEYSPYVFNRALPGSRLRPDAVNYQNRIVRELKPDNPKAVSRGWRQVNEYKAYLEELTGEKWTAYVDTYKQ